MIWKKNYIETGTEMIIITVEKLILKWLMLNFIQTKTEMILNTGISL